MVRVMTSHSVAAAVACAVSLLASACTSGVQATSAVAFPQGMTLELHRVAETSHSESYRRRRMQDVDGKMGVVPLNPGLGTHYAWVYAGTPPQRASVITDTGSSLMAFPCSGYVCVIMTRSVQLLAALCEPIWRYGLRLLLTCL